MSKENKKLVPELRFAEFEGEWEERVLGNKKVSIFVNEKMPKEDLNIETYVSTENLLPDFEGVKKAAKLPNSGSFTYYKAGDTLIANIRPYLRKVWFASYDGGASNDVIVIRASSEIENLFLLHILKNDRFINYVMKGAKGVKMPRGDKSLMKKYFVPVPKLPEQQKIAATLTTLDDLIAAEKERLDALQAHKKGLLQQLFPAKGERVPKVRFGEFSGDWEKKRVENACEKPFSGSTPKSSNDNYYGGDIPFIRSAEINKDKTELFLTQLGFDNSSAKMVKKGDVLIALYGANSGDVAISKIKGAINQAILCLRSKTNNEFLYQYLTLRKEWIISTYLQGGQGNLSGEIVKSVELYFPQDKNEEEKIANCLSSLDDLIAAQAEKIEVLKAHKKGLMQGLFPAV